MLNKRLLKLLSNSKKYVAANVVLQWFGLIFNIIVIVAIANFLSNLYYNGFDSRLLFYTLGIAVLSISVRFVLVFLSHRMSYLSSREVKTTLRSLIYKKLLKLGPSYREMVNTSEVVQVAVEGVEQLETYFGQYLPQFFYALVAPVTLFAVLSFISFNSAIALLLCVPLIPITIVFIQKIAKRLLAKYWSQYATLGDSFLENLQGLTLTKIYQSDDFKHRQMNEDAEKFRKITMKVLTMQLNSITVMDLIAYGGAGVGIILSSYEFCMGVLDLTGALIIILLSADFFLPMRLLGSYFHIAMNGIAASGKIFRLLDLKEDEERKSEIISDCSINVEKLSFSYTEDREILKGVDFSFPMGSFSAIVGESGSGKSTVAAILMGRNKGYDGTVKVGNLNLSSVSEKSIMEHFTYVTHQSYLFEGTVRENLLIASPGSDDDALWRVLDRVKLSSFLHSENGLDTYINEKASNLSGGQIQRLALARAILHDTPVYIFDEATSNIDVESENDIMTEINNMAGSKTVILITHRLMNVIKADNIYVLENGSVVETGTHEMLLSVNGAYCKLWETQCELEAYTKAEV